MLRELRTTDKRGEPRRKWFADAYFDLIVWLAADDGVDGFQLCYDVGHSERALTWDRYGGFSHNRVDDGESGPTTNSTPILVAEGHFPANEIIARLEESCAQINASISKVVIEKVRAYAARRHTA